MGISKKTEWKELGRDLLADAAGGFLMAVGLYNFAINANFPVAGFSGIALILYHLFGVPVGLGTAVLNIPVIILCYKYLGKGFLLKSIKSTIIVSVMMDYVAPLLPIYDGNRMLAAICMGVLTGAGLAIVFMRGSSTGGQDFIMMSVKKMKPHMSLGAITFALDMIIIAVGFFVVFKEVDGLIYGTIVTYIMAVVMNRILYGIDGGKMTFIVTEHGEEVARQIDEYSGRGSTILHGHGSFSGQQKDIVMCACNNKQMFVIKKMVHRIDPRAFSIILESNEVVGEGFKEEVKEMI